MFLGLLDAQGEAISPKVLSRVPAETITWMAEYSSDDKIMFVNSASLRMQAYENVFRMIDKIALFREIDDMKPFVPPSDVRTYNGVRKHDFMMIEPRGLRFTLNLRSGGNQPDAAPLLDMVDKLTDQSLKHLHFIHDIAYTATGDLRVLAREYLKVHGGFDRIR